MCIRRSRLALSRAPVLHPGLTTKNQDAAIQLVMNHAIATLGLPLIVDAFQLPPRGLGMPRIFKSLTIARAIGRRRSAEKFR